jgi:anti-anti-sigma factor
MDGALVPEFSVERNPGADVLNVSGEVDLASSPELQALIETTPAGTKLIVDLTQCTYLDSSTLSVLVRAFKARGPALCLVLPPEARIRRLFAVTKLEDVFSIVPDRAAAFA